MSRLANLVLLSKSGVTRLIDRLEADGYVERSQCATDARGAEAVLTEAGLTRLREAARTHLGGIERYFLGPLDDADLEAIGRTMTAIARLVGEDGDEIAPEAADATAVTAAGEALVPAR
jgi:DNA-binding MarR family transcriptional regulator